MELEILCLWAQTNSNIYNQLKEILILLKIERVKRNFIINITFNVCIFYKLTVSNYYTDNILQK